MPGIDLSQYGPTILYFVVIIAVFYFILIRPQKKKDKEHKAMISSLKKGDKIVTIGGFHAKVVSVKDNVLTVMIGDTKVRLEQWAIKTVVSASKDEELPEAKAEETVEENTEE